MLPTLASACFLQRNAASIARGLFTRCAGPSLLSMKLHQHQYPRSGLQASGSDPGHGARRPCRCISVRPTSTTASIDQLAVPIFQSDTRACSVRCRSADSSRRQPDCILLMRFPAPPIAYGPCLACADCSYSTRRWAHLPELNLTATLFRVSVLDSTKSHPAGALRHIYCPVGVMQSRH